MDDIREMLGECGGHFAQTREMAAWAPTGKTWLPEGWRQIKSANVFEKDGQLVITAMPDEAYPGFEDDDEGHPHNCDAEGCGWDHVVADGKLRRI